MQPQLLFGKIYYVLVFFSFLKKMVFMSNRANLKWILYSSLALYWNFKFGILESTYSTSKLLYSHKFKKVNPNTPKWFNHIENWSPMEYWIFGTKVITLVQIKAPNIPLKRTYNINIKSVLAFSIFHFKLRATCYGQKKPKKHGSNNL